LDAGRHCLKKWGFRRCEDICWIKTNAEAARKVAARQDAHAVLQHTKVGATPDFALLIFCHAVGFQPCFLPELVLNTCQRKI
jgi:hypothetical protein